MLLPVVPVCWLVSSVVSSFLSMPTTRPTFNSLSADLFSTPSTSAPPSSGDSGGVSSVASGTSNSLSNEIAVAVAQAFQQSLPSFVAAFHAENLAAPVSSTALPPVSSVLSSVVSSVVPGLAMVAASSLSSVAGTLRLPSFVYTFPAISSTPGSCSARLARSISAPIMASHVTSFSSHGESLAASGVKAFVVGPGHAPIPAKLVKKITSGEFVELADLLSTNLRAVDLEPQSFLDSKLLVSRKRRLVEVEDILTWTEAFTIYQMVICASHPHRWSDLTKYKLLIIQTARHAPGRSWLEYDTAFRKDAAATGASDWSRMNLDLYNFHLRSSVPPLLYHCPLARPHRSPRLEVAAPVPRTVIFGTEVSAFGRLEIAASAIRATHVTVTTLGSAVHSIPPAPSVPVPPPPPREGGPERVLMPSTFPVHSVYNVPIVSDQPSGLPGSVTSFCSSSVDLSGTSVPVRSFSPLAPVHLVSLLQLFQFQVELADCPNQAAAAYVLNGLRDGFQVGFETPSVSLWSSSSNMRSAFDHPSVIDAYLENEVSCGRVAGPFSSPPFTDLHISRFGVVPKSNQPGKWRLILDLSSPVGHSVNDGIPKSPFSIQYVTVDAFIDGIMA